MMGLGLRVAQVQALSLAGGMSDSIFPCAERLLFSSGDYQHALEYVGRRKDMGRYESVMDFLFCELYPVWRSRCFRFYLGRERPLRDRLSKEAVALYDQQLVVALEVAKALWAQDLPVKKWGHYQELVQSLVA